MNTTYQSIIDALHCTLRVWDKVKDNLQDVTIINCKGGRSYGLSFQGVFLGVFVKVEYINLEDLKETPFKYENNRTLNL